MANVTLTSVDKVYPGDVKAVNNFSLEIADKEFLVLVGPSGCGKSTILRMIAGLEEITSGEIKIGEQVVNDVPPKDRDIAMVFQNYALYPHMTVFDNMAFGLKLRKYKTSLIKERVNEAAEILGIGELLDRRPKALSGGQRQRVAVGRAIVRKPKVFLFDEPLSNLDAKMRVQMRVEISRLHRQLEATMIYVTHDQTEAMTMGDRIVVMKDGIAQQVARPVTLYDEPANKFVASFIGTPPMNFFDGTVQAQGETLSFQGGSFSLALPAAWRKKAGPYAGKDVIFGIRPEDLGSPAAEQVPDAPRITAGIDVIEPMGSESYVHLRTGDHTFISRVDAHRRISVGDDADLAVFIGKAHMFDAESKEMLV